MRLKVWKGSRQEGGGAIAQEAMMSASGWTTVLYYNNWILDWHRGCGMFFGFFAVATWDTVAKKNCMSQKNRKLKIQGFKFTDRMTVTWNLQTYKHTFLYCRFFSRDHSVVKEKPQMTRKKFILRLTLYVLLCFKTVLTDQIDHMSYRFMMESYTPNFFGACALWITFSIQIFSFCKWYCRWVCVIGELQESQFEVNTLTNTLTVWL